MSRAQRIRRSELHLKRKMKLSPALIPSTVQLSSSQEIRSTNRDLYQISTTMTSMGKQMNNKCSPDH